VQLVHLVPLPQLVADVVVDEQAVHRQRRSSRRRP